jgi:phosphatidylglycerol lysyltransferase
MTVPLELRISLLRQYGTFANAYAATFQPGLEHFGDERGFLAYRMVGTTAFVLGDAIASPHARADLISRFVDEKRDVCFCAASRSTADLLAAADFFINEMGPENRLDLDSFSLSGRVSENLRYAFNRISKLGYVTREHSFASLDFHEVNAVSEAWRRTRTVHGREIAFLNRPIVLGDEPDVRKFFTFDRDQKLVAFAFFDPVYENGRTVGYYNQIKRHLPGVDPRMTNAMMCHAIKQFKQEGRKWLFLGISPFADIKHVEDNGFKRSWWVKRCFRTAYKNPLFNRYVYPFRGLHEHKRRFHAVTEQTYYASNRYPSLLRMLKMLVACSILPTVSAFDFGSTPGGLAAPTANLHEA